MGYQLRSPTVDPVESLTAKDLEPPSAQRETEPERDQQERVPQLAAVKASARPRRSQNERDQGAPAPARGAVGAYHGTPLTLLGVVLPDALWLTLDERARAVHRSNASRQRPSANLLARAILHAHLPTGNDEALRVALAFERALVEDDGQYASSVMRPRGVRVYAPQRVAIDALNGYLRREGIDSHASKLVGGVLAGFMPDEGATEAVLQELARAVAHPAAAEEGTDLSLHVS